MHPFQAPRQVLSPGAPLFLSFIDGRYSVAIHEVPEFLRARADWVSDLVGLL